MENSFTKASSLLSAYTKQLMIIVSPLAVLGLGIFAFKYFTASTPQDVSKATGGIITVLCAYLFLLGAPSLVELIASCAASLT